MPSAHSSPQDWWLTFGVGGAASTEMDIEQGSRVLAADTGAREALDAGREGPAASQEGGAPAADSGPEASGQPNRGVDNAKGRTGVQASNF
mmetsp:Transcript_112984/g.211838  ORF Transcript_112984/g.211838 Transcript_112984/m.211838 type:complete len:91 (+) Transcript_112984:390-662(+)